MFYACHNNKLYNAVFHLHVKVVLMGSQKTIAVVHDLSDVLFTSFDRIHHATIKQGHTCNFDRMGVFVKIADKAHRLIHCRDRLPTSGSVLVTVARVVIDTKPSALQRQLWYLDNVSVEQIKCDLERFKTGAMSWPACLQIHVDIQRWKTFCVTGNYKMLRAPMKHRHIIRKFLERLKKLILIRPKRPV